MNKQTGEDINRAERTLESCSQRRLCKIAVMRNQRESANDILNKKFLNLRSRETLMISFVASHLNILRKIDH